MTKAENVIKALQLCRYDPDPGQECKFLVSCDICPYWHDEHGCRWTDLLNDALELLKANYKSRESRKMLPCKCGCKIRAHWFSGSSDKPEGLKCMKCGFTVWGKDGMDVIRKWNEAVKQNDED